MAAELRPLTLSTEADAQLRLQALGHSMTGVTSLADQVRLLPHAYKASRLEGTESASLEAGVAALGGEIFFSPSRTEAILFLSDSRLGELAEHIASQSPLAGQAHALAKDSPASRRWCDGVGNSLLANQGTTIMGVLNVTPDSFSDGGQYVDPGVAEEHALRMVADGAHIIDIGGLSTRPGSQPVSVEEEINRTQPVIQRLAGRIGVPLSIDTYRSQVAQRALDAGATIVNDVSGFRFDKAMSGVCARGKAGVVLMHTSATPDVMMQHTEYGDLVDDIRAALQQSMDEAQESGIAAECIALDPGFGFGKTADQGWGMLRRLPEFRGTGRPLLIGISRKSFFRTILGEERPPADRDVASGVAAAAAVIAGGADIVRTHNVFITRDCLAVADRLTKPPGP